MGILQQKSTELLLLPDLLRILASRPEISKTTYPVSLQNFLLPFKKIHQVKFLPETAIKWSSDAFINLRWHRQQHKLNSAANSCWSDQTLQYTTELTFPTSTVLKSATFIIFPSYNISSVYPLAELFK